MFLSEGVLCCKQVLLVPPWVGTWKPNCVYFISRVHNDTQSPSEVPSWQNKKILCCRWEVCALRGKMENVSTRWAHFVSVFSNWTEVKHIFQLVELCDLQLIERREAECDGEITCGFVWKGPGGWGSGPWSGHLTHPLWRSKHTSMFAWTYLDIVKGSFILKPNAVFLWYNLVNFHSTLHCLLVWLSHSSLFCVSTILEKSRISDKSVVAGKFQDSAGNHFFFMWILAKIFEAVKFAREMCGPCVCKRNGVQQKWKMIAS